MFIRKAIQLKMLSLDSYYKVVGQRYKKLIALHLKRAPRVLSKILDILII